MTVAEIQSVVASYLQRSVEKFDVAGTEVNLVLLAMNNARKYAERRHNWNVCRKKGYFLVDPAVNRVELSSPVWFDGGNEKLKEGKHWWIRGSGDVVNETVSEDRVLKVIDQGVKYRLEAEREYGGAWWDEREGRRMSEECHPLLQQPYAVSRGKWIELYPKPTEEKIVVVDGYHWWPNWTGGGVEKWSVVLPTNVFVNRNDDSYLHIDVLTPEERRRIVLYLDNAMDGTAVSMLTPPHGKVTIAHLAIVSTGFTKNNVFNALEALGWDVEIVGDSVKIVVKGEPMTATVEMYNSDSAITEFVLSMAAIQESGVVDLALESDWWTENAEEFLILRSVVEANRLGQAFVGNKEGNLPPPVKEAEAALELLIKQDEDTKMAGGAIEIY